VLTLPLAFSPARERGQEGAPAESLTDVLGLYLPKKTMAMSVPMFFLLSLTGTTAMRERSIAHV
jgi:hypothetical protein